MKNADPTHLTRQSNSEQEACGDPGLRAKPWMAAFGKLRHLRKENARISRIIEEEFEQIEPEGRM